MGGAPIGPVKALPDDWVAQVQAYKAAGPAALFIERIKEIVATLGEKSIVLRWVQELAPAACGLGPTAPFGGHAQILERLMLACGGGWPIEEPLKEYKIKKRIEEVDKDLRSLEAEWLVLDRLISEMWSPVSGQRDKALPDWRVRKSGHEISVDAKQKAPMRGTHVLLTWVLRGLAHLSHWAFLRRYSWEWSVPAESRAQMVNHFVDQLLAGGQALQACLASPLTDDVEELIGAPHLVLERYDDQTFLLTCCLKGELMHVTASPNRHLHLFNPGGVQTATIEEVIAEKTLEELAPILGRVGLDKKQQSLIIVVWPVPFDWEPNYDRPRLEAWWQKACEDQAWPPAILWPVGHFEVRETPWLASAAAKTVLDVARRTASEGRG